MTEQGNWLSVLDSWLSKPDPLLYLDQAPGPQKPAARLAEHGIRAGVVRLEAVTDKTTLMQAIARDLKWPSWFGANWDALADLLAGYEEDEAGSFVLLLAGWPEFTARDPDSAAILLEIIEDVQSQPDSPLSGAILLT